MRARLAGVLIAALLGVLALAGCGTPFQLPTETRSGRLLPSDRSYQMVATWTNMDGIADILLTQGPGSQLFLLFQRPGAGTAARGDVFAYALKARPPAPPPLSGISFRGLFNPHALCASPGRVFVLDQGDTLLAENPGDLKVGDLTLTWRVREYGLLGGDTISTFTDTSMAYVQGIAADGQGRIYVSGSAIVWIPDQQDPKIKTRTFQYRVNRYLKDVPGAPPDLYMPGTTHWVRDQTFIVEEGSGLGTLSDPRGLYWTGAAIPGGDGLFAADFAKNWVQKLSDATSSTALFKIDTGRDTLFSGPEDVAVDLQGFVYVADTGNRRVLRFDPYGAYVQAVNVEPDADGRPLAGPVAVAADDSLVYVADRAAGRVVRYQRRK